MDIKKLIDKKKYTKADKDFLVAEGAKYGIEPPKKDSCPDCWRDMAIRIAVAMKPQAAATSRRLRGNAARNGVIFKGRLITNATLDEETLAWMDANGFPQQLLEDAES